MKASPVHERRRRRGVALLAALWLVVMITTAGLQFATVARERRQLGRTSVDVSRDRAALEGMLATLQARLESEERQRLRVDARRVNTRRTVGVVDPWQNLSGRLATPLAFDDRLIAARVTDLGTVLNVNLAGEAELASLITAVTGDAEEGDRLSQAILDWRDEDTVPRADGAEADRYAQTGTPVRPPNGMLQSVDELQDVWGMSPARFAQLRPYLTVDGAVRRVNLNAAPAAVLRTLPGMTEPLLTAILALRSRGRRVESIPALVSSVQNAGRAGSGERDALVRLLTDKVTVDTRDVALELTVAEAGENARARLVAVLRRNADGTVDVGATRW
jgi:general secretion pathway protein K